MSDQDQGASASSPPLRLRASPKARRQLHRCPTHCPFTEGVACEPTAPVARAPRDLRPYLPGDVEYVCEGCVPKAEAALATLKEERDRERREKAQAKRAAKEAKRAARAAADAAQAELRQVVGDVEGAKARFEDLSRTADERRRARAQERREALLHLRACEAAVRKAERELEEAKRAISDLPRPEAAVGVEIDREGLRQALVEAHAKARDALEQTTPSYRRKHGDRALLKQAGDLADWLDPDAS